MKSLHPFQIFLFIIVLIPLIIYEGYRIGEKENYQECINSPFTDPPLAEWYCQKHMKEYLSIKKSIEILREKYDKGILF